MRIFAIPNTRGRPVAALLVSSALAAGLALASCTADSGHDPLRDTRWRFTVIDGDKPQRPDAHIAFTSDKLAVSLGCNAMTGGKWSVSQNRLVAGPLAATEMACMDGTWSQEQAVGALLAAQPRLLVDGNRMTLQSSGHTAELIRDDGG